MKNLLKNNNIKILLVALLFLFLPHIATASNFVGMITITQGRVDLLRSGTDKAVPVYAGDQLAVGDVIRTKSESKVEISLNDGSVIRLAQETRFKISESLFVGGKRKKSSFRLFRGKVRAIVSKKSASNSSGNFEIHTPTAIGGVRGTDFYVYYIGSSGILVIEGTVAVFSPAVGKEVLVTAGYATNVGHGKPPDTPRPVTKSEIDKHDKDTNPNFDDSNNRSEVSFISNLVGELEPFERHLYVFELLAKNDPPPPPPTEPPPIEPPPTEPPPIEPPPTEPPPIEPPPTEPPPTEPPPTEPPPIEPPPADLPFPPPPPPPDNGNVPPPPWTPEGPPGDPTPPGPPAPGAPAPEPPPVTDPPPAPPVPAPGNSGLPFPPPANAPQNSPNTPPPWTPEGPPGNPKPGRPN